VYNLEMQPPKKGSPIKEALRTKAGMALAAQTTVSLDQHAVDEGRKPLAPRRKDLAAIRAKFLEMYGLPAGGIAPIDGSFKFTAAESDADHNFLHVESLIEQAGHLLERCAAERMQRDLWLRERFHLQIELDEFLRLDSVREQERQAGAATLAYERAAIEGSVEGSLAENIRNSEAQLKELLDELVSTGFDRRTAAKELSAWISAYPLKDRELAGDDASYSFDGARKSKPDHLFDAARSDADETAWELVYATMSRRYALLAAAEAARLRKESVDRQAKFSLAEIAFRSEREQAARDTVWEKIYQAQAADGILNYNRRIALAEAQFAADFREALARLTAAQRGFKELYGYAPEFPKEGADGYFDAVVYWTRTAASRLATFAQQDQTYVLALSLKDLAKSQWEAGLAASEWTFEVPEDLFPGQAHVRLRGVGAAVAIALPEPTPAKAPAPKLPDTPVPDGYWSARVTASLALPVCFLGRVTAWNSPHEPEIAGASVLHNASPIGKQWKLALSPKSTTGVPASRLQDITLYLHVAVRGRQA
jgi:hypothetical protein